MSYSCPLCHAPLARRDNSFICPQRHQFDLAKEGYVNLLPVQFKRSRDPGDSAEMMQARREFLGGQRLSAHLRANGFTGYRLWGRLLHSCLRRYRRPLLGTGRVEIGDSRGGKALSAGQLLRRLQPAITV